MSLPSLLLYVMTNGTKPKKKKTTRGNILMCLSANRVECEMFSQCDRTGLWFETKFRRLTHSFEC
uniref:Uncharacterized protein n=1 Tax=Anguilla anguilla TaxID=7936 RepID=A0A0E9WL99_ANGAN